MARTQRGAAVDAIALTDDLARASTHALNETHRRATATKRDAVDVYKAQLAEIDTRENRIVDVERPAQEGGPLHTGARSVERAAELALPVGQWATERM